MPRFKKFTKWMRKFRKDKPKRRQTRVALEEEGQDQELESEHQEMPYSLPEYDSSDESVPSVTHICGPDTCTRDCLTCGPPSVYLKQLSQINKRFDHKYKKMRYFGKGADQLGTAPIKDAAGHIPKNIKLGEAIGLLMQEGIVEAPDLTAGKNVKILKGYYRNVPRSSSSENSMIEAVRSAQPYQFHFHEEMTPAARSKSEPSVRTKIDEACNTSFQDITSPLEFQDSMMKVKLRRYLDDNSCTQYFALRSRLQLEAYLKAVREQDADAHVELVHLSSHMVGLNKAQSDDAIVLKQKGVLALSKASVYSDWEILRRAGAPMAISETEIAATGKETRPTPGATPQRSVSDKVSEDTLRPTIIFSNKELEIRSTSTVESSGKKDAAPVGKRRTCRTCHQDHEVEEQINIVDLTPSRTMQSFQMVCRKEGSPDRTILITDDKLQTDENPLDDNMAQLNLVIHTLKPSVDLITGLFSCYNISEKSNQYLLSWRFLKVSESYNFSLENAVFEKNIELNEARTYKFEMTPGVYLFLLRCSLDVELYNVVHGREILIGKCKLDLGRCLEDISKAYESTVRLQNKDLRLCMDYLEPLEFGSLVIRFRMRGNQAYFDKMKPAPRPEVSIPPLIDAHESIFPFSTATTARNSISVHGSVRTNIVSEAELKAFQDGLNLVLVRNKALRTTQEEITQELKERTTWMHEELKWRLTLQENAILCGKDPDAIKWRQWKDDSTANVRYRPIAYEEFFKNGVAHVEIEILELTLHVDSKPMLNDNLTHLYIELSFLNKTGKDMETLTMRKPIDDKQAVRFRFVKVFDIAADSREGEYLAEMIKNNESIPFLIIAQPAESSSELQSCYEFGIANLVLFNLLQSRYNTTVEDIPVHDSYTKAHIGQLSVRFVGVLAIRSMALHILTPPTFKIIR